MRWCLMTAVVQGPSMVPSLRDGDAVLARRGGRPARPGDVVLARFRSRPDLLVVKRVVRVEAGTEDPGRVGWWIEGDNPFGTDDSRSHGLADVEARVVLVWWPSLRRL